MLTFTELWSRRNNTVLTGGARRGDDLANEDGWITFERSGARIARGWLVDLLRHSRNANVRPGRLVRAIPTSDLS